MGWGKSSWSGVELQVLNSETNHFGKIVGHTFAKHCSTGLFTLNFHLLDYPLEDLRKLDTLSDLDTPSFEHYTVHIRTSYRITWKRMEKRIAEII